MNAKTFLYPVTIKETFLDTFGHVNNAAYLTLFEEARWELINSNNYGLEKIKETGLGFTVLDIKIEYRKELRLREEIIIKTNVTSYIKKICTLTQKMLRGDEICCTAEFTMGLFSLKERRLVLPTSDWLRAIGINENT